MSDEIDKNRDIDSKTFLVRSSHGNKVISLENIKSMYIAEGLDAKQIAEQSLLPVEKIQEIINKHNLPELRKAYILEGVKHLQNIQIQQSQKLMDLDSDFKKLRLIQLESQLKEYLAYFARHGDFYKRHPITGDIMKDIDGIALQIHIPNVSREITQLRESVTMSEGIKQLLNRLDEIINYNPPKDIAAGRKEDALPAEYNTIFEPSDD